MALQLYPFRRDRLLNQSLEKSSYDYFGKGSSGDGDQGVVYNFEINQ